MYMYMYNTYIFIKDFRHRSFATWTYICMYAYVYITYVRGYIHLILEEAIFDGERRYLTLEQVYS